MATLSPTYSVVLRSDIPPLERELLEHFCAKIISRSGEPLLHFLCTKIDLSHFHYIAMETFTSGAEDTHPVHVPHQYVLLISGDEARPSIGFLADLKE
ncbi:MAG: hypothetical protein JWP44_4892 [Mucilaginibacter sp.]|nr:hypothetical protein [Mucilaginibacter sp.]